MAARDDLISFMAELPLVSKAKATSFVVSLERTIEDKARAAAAIGAEESVKPWVIGSIAASALAVGIALWRTRRREG